MKTVVFPKFCWPNNQNRQFILHYPRNRSGTALAPPLPSYKVPEEADPLGSGTDEEDKIYIEVDENAEPEEPSEKIEKVLTHRTGPAWGNLFF